MDEGHIMAGVQAAVKDEIDELKGQLERIEEKIDILINALLEEVEEEE